MELVLLYLNAHVFTMVHRMYKDTCFNKDVVFGKQWQWSKNIGVWLLFLSSYIFHFQCVHGRSVELHWDQLLRLVISFRTINDWRGKLWPQINDCAISLPPSGMFSDRWCVCDDIWRQDFSPARGVSVRPGEEPQQQQIHSHAAVHYLCRGSMHDDLNIHSMCTHSHLWCNVLIFYNPVRWVCVCVYSIRCVFSQWQWCWMKMWVTKSLWPERGTL